MSKYLLLSILFANVVVPLLFASDPLPRRGLRRTIGTMVAFNILYLLALVLIFPRLS